jgi:hypothetical protein
VCYDYRWELVGGGGFSIYGEVGNALVLEHLPDHLIRDIPTAQQNDGPFTRGQS